MYRVSTSSLKVLWNRDKSDQFYPSRGIRQGDPFSSYLFVIFMERLTHMIEEAVERKIWLPLKVGRHGSSVSHLLFVNDLLIFAEASISQIDSILKILNDFCDVSGHRIN